MEVKKIAVWGTGKYGHQFMEKLTVLNDLYSQLFGINLQNQIAFFVDSDKSKQGQIFWNKDIVGFEQLVQNNIRFCIVSIHVNGRDVYDMLKAKGIQAISDVEFITKIKQQIINHREEVLKSNNLMYITQRSENFQWTALEIKKIIQRNKKNHALSYLIFSILLDNMKYQIDINSAFSDIVKNYELEFIVSAISWYYDNEITRVMSLLEEIKLLYDEKKRKKTIGILVQRYYGGGIEKVISLLIPLYLQRGYKVVLMTDRSTYDKDKDFFVDKSVIRYFLQYGMEDNQEQRIKELIQCIDTYDIDVVCFHSGYARLETFYEMLAVKLHGKLVLLEIHSAIQTIMDNNRDIENQLIAMYKITDQLIVLSEYDRQFLSKNGCRCTYIPNPVDKKLELFDPEKIRKSADTIVWVGRIVQNPKCVLDTVPIIRSVKERIPNVKLYIVGNADQGRIYNELRNQIKESGLQKNIYIREYCTQIQDVYRNADLVLMTSISESFSNVILESKVLGLPLIMYEIPWLELTADQKGVIAVKQRDIEGIAEKIIMVLEDYELRKRLAMEARESAEFFLSYDIGKKWEECFKEI